jgi:hypothetical protein
MSGIPYKASVPKLLPSTVRSCKRGNRLQANASSSSRSAFVHPNPGQPPGGRRTGTDDRPPPHQAITLVLLVSAALLAVFSPTHRLALRQVPVTATGTSQTGHDGVAAADLPPGLAQARHLARHQIMGAVPTDGA